MITRCLILLLPLGALGQDAGEIIRQSLKRDMRNESVAKDYTYKALNRIRELDSAGHVKTVHSTLEESLFIGGGDYLRLLEKDGKALPAADEKKEQQKLDRASKEAAAMTDAERQKRETERLVRRKKNRERLQYLPDAFDFTLERETAIEGRKAWQIRANRRVGYKGPYAFLFRNMEGTLWVDQEDYQWVKVEADVLDTISIGLFLARIGKGTRISFERSKVNGELWAMTHIVSRASARLALLKKVNEEQEISFSEYRKFQTDSRIVE